MASTTKTDNLHLSQFVESDQPKWLVDYNDDMEKIDKGVSILQPKRDESLQTTNKEISGAINEIVRKMEEDSWVSGCFSNPGIWDQSFNLNFMYNKSSSLLWINGMARSQEEFPQINRKVLLNLNEVPGLTLPTTELHFYNTLCLYINKGSSSMMWNGGITFAASGEGSVQATNNPTTAIVYVNCFIPCWPG